MKPRDIVKKTLEFASPPRIPRQLWTLPWAKDNYSEKLEEIQKRFPDDIIGSPGFYKQIAKTTGEPYEIGNFIDEWGCKFINKQKGVIGEVKEPLLKSLDDIDQLTPPEEMLTLDRDQINEFCRNTDKFIMAGCCPRPFERCQFIRKTDNFFYDLAEHPSEVKALINKLHQFYIKELELWAKTEVDGLTFMDDWGTQKSLLISPKMWREYFKPCYKDYIDIAHSYKKPIFMHSDGHTASILPDLIELGLDAINTQIFCMDIEKLGKLFKGKITFWGEIDRQYLLSFANTQEIDQAVRRVKNNLFANGGVIAQCEFGAGAKPENVYQVFKTWEEIG
jgi:uroporphyrinogen decarboxylase